MTETLDLQGRWWLPGHDDHRVFGTLRWDPDSGGTLHVEGELRPVVWKDNVLADGSIQKYRDDRGDQQRNYPVVLGQADNRAYTLLDCFRLSLREHGGDEATERVHVNRVLDGAWFDDRDGLRVDRVVVDLRHLTGWVGHSGLSAAHPRMNGDDADVFTVATAKTLPSFQTAHAGGSVLLAQSLSETGDHIHDLGVRQRWSLRVHQPEPEPLDLFMATVSDFQDLLTLAVGKPASFESIRLQHPSLPKRSLDGKPIGNWREDIAYHAQWSTRSEQCEPVDKHSMYFTFDDLGGIDGVARWLAVAADYRTELGRVMATRYSDAMYLEDRIMNISAALDSFDKHRRGTGKWVEYIRRIRQCIDLAGQPFADLIGGQDAEKWADSVTATRDDLAHHRERFRVDGSVGEHLLAEQLFWLFALSLLRLAKAPEAVFESIGRHRQVRWLTEQARANGG